MAGHANQAVARRYAAAIFALANEGDKAAEVGADLHALRESLLENDDVRRFFLSPVVQRVSKITVLEAAFSAHVDAIALHALLLLVRKRREALLGAIEREYSAMLLASEGKATLQIVSARALDPAEIERIVAQLAGPRALEFEVEQRVDPGLLGGARITYGDHSVDGSIAGRLEQLGRQLASTPP